ncbi:TPA: ABC transporter ATP-binding protein [Corynebacterium striatum]|uniref:ABC transporter ATP-binding protein n=1 Tax=Corynebacterium striatum TaxID=43770 RepID=A0AAQ1TUM1_CORST|nr:MULTISPECIES: ABC transporter ATP-binding protein [Actinomycetes]ATZ05874.1 ABC transporter ATP-binding protein [Corynebacterium striatum]ATZ09733.1 ABC transporter ATP-binding protein [Corynebacterium striatum]EEI77896.1 ABC transporter, ATP-binding protein [Corynebacterium striatum ATCC 6940]EGT5613411.1 ABC transporter ATP-binding protein [Corynebacterium striatum]MDK8877931.1 ABC transporter ATP-binding protein [Corynebacterium striatum]
MIRTLLALIPIDRRRAFFGFIGFTLLSVIARALAVVLLIPVLGSLLGADPATAWPWVGMLLLVVCGDYVIATVASRIGLGTGFALLDTGQETVSKRLAAVELDWFTATNTATARQAIAATGPTLVGLVLYFIGPFISAAIMPLMIALALLFVKWQLGLAALAGVPLLLGAFVASRRLGERSDAVAAEANTTLSERIIEFARTQQVLRSARRVDAEQGRAGQALAAQRRSMLRQLVFQLPGQIVFGVASQLALILLAATAVVLAIHGQLSPAEAIAVIVVIVRYLEPFTVLAELSSGVESVVNTLQQIRSVFEAPIADSGRLSHRCQHAPTIELRDVCVSVAADQPVLSGINLEFAAGTTTAIIGPSGSGKSTLLSVIAGLKQPTSGDVLFDGVAVGELDSESKRELVSVVFQQPYLFDGTIRENVLAGDPEANDAQVAHAARAARIDGLLADRVETHTGRVGEGGTALSGGERQRVSIARALLKPAPVLLIDEATSALDNDNEAAINDAFAEDERSQTSVIVTHRLSSLKHVDRVIVLDGGRVVEDGAPAELAQAGGRFAAFWQHQEAATGWRLGRGS